MKKILLLFSAFLFTFISYAQWQPDVRLTYDPANSLVTTKWCIASSGDSVHVVWYDDRDGNKEIYYKRSTDGGSNWGADTRLTNNTSVSWHPSIKVSGSSVHVVWYDTRDGNEEIYYKRSTDGGTSWGADTRLTNNTAESSYPSVSVSGSEVHVVWKDYRDGNYEIYYKRSTDGGISWGVDTRLTSDSAISESPSVSVSGSSVHVAWHDYRDLNWEIYYKRSTDGGVNWGTDTRLTSYAGNSINPSVAVSGQVVHVVWMDDHDGNYEIYYKRSTDGGLNWGTDTRLTNNSAASWYPSISVSNSVLHVTWQDYRDGNYEIYYKRSMNTGVNWETDTRLTNYTGESYFPTVSLSGQVVHVVWYDRRDGNYEIYYKRNPTGTPVIKAVLNNIYRPDDGRIQTALITLSDSSCIGQIDSVWWYINDSLIGRQHLMTFTYKQGTTNVKLKIKNNNYIITDSVSATVTRITWKRYTGGQIRAGESLIGDSVLYAIATSDKIYKMDINGNTVYTINVNGNILSSCSIGYDTSIFIGSSDYNLYGFNRWGFPLWPAYPLGGTISTTPTIDSISNRLYVGVENGNFGGINKTSGTLGWGILLNAPIKSSAVISNDRKLICVSAIGTVYGFNLNNPTPLPPNWTLNLNDSVLVSPAIDADRYFYFGSRGGKIYKVNLQTGSTNCGIVWQTSALGSPVTSSLTIDGRGNLYFGTADGKLYSVKLSNGAITWNFQTSGPIRSTAAISPNGTVYFGNDAREIYGLDTNKNIKFYYIDSSKVSCAMLYDKGTLYYGNEAGRLFAVYDTTGGSITDGNAMVPMWATFQNNNRRTGNLGDGAIGIRKISDVVPLKYELYQNYPNPFNPFTTIKFDIAKESEVKIVIYDILGRETATPVNKKMNAGKYEVKWNMNMYASGVYFYRIEVRDPGKQDINFMKTKKMVLIK